MMPAGAGKSLPFQILALLNKNNELDDDYRNSGITVVIMSLIS